MSQGTKLLANTAMSGSSRLLQVAYGAAELVAPGQWFRLQLPGQGLQLAVLDASKREGWLAFQGPGEVAGHARGTYVELSAPQGEPIHRPAGERRLVLIADEAGLPAILFAASRGWPIHLALIGLTATEPPLRLRPSRFLLPGFGPGAIAGIAVLEDAGIPSRIAHPHPLPGCQEGTLAQLVTGWLDAQSARQRWQMAATVLGEEVNVQRVDALLRGQIGAHHRHVMPCVSG